MEQPAATRTEQTPRSDERAGASSRKTGAVIIVIFFGLLLTVTLTIDALRDTSTMSSLALTQAGIMLFAGVAELLDPAARRLVAGVRYGGMAMALLGLVLQFVG
ncbi:hypothetical protein [Brachybacterium paraconglomeratum]|uniref:hypothetical protein n=1 Tax=Brachybacterium paraconglomeratum TaxID=173362 RepID=UPI00026C752B|nr:hypothetical protein [Brachybacterium paraconglomeratum]